MHLNFLKLQICLIAQQVETLQQQVYKLCITICMHTSRDTYIVQKIQNIYICTLQSTYMDKYTFTLIVYTLLYYIEEILRRGMHNLSYIYIWECLHQHSVPLRQGVFPYYIGKILRTSVQNISHTIYYI